MEVNLSLMSSELVTSEYHGSVGVSKSPL